MFVKQRDVATLFFVCPDCGCAWEQLPTPGVVETVDPPNKFAPEGWVVATRAEIDAAGMRDFVWRECHFDESVFDGMPGFSRRG